ncbi:MAG: exodeoxyribonuclease VII small subunit [Opitutae bacterium]|nr:exodeoxyribonuclease VII small subunit [Opitutae bacterium]|tara:strand:+ start:17280 stop:17546 length:267 start_codon:yes stop_codon:yes gene_type:complete
MADKNTGLTEINDGTEISFEDALSQLEEVIHRMESGESPLESLVENYESGVRLLKLCRNKIELAEMKVKKVSAKDGNQEAENFSLSNE